MSWLSGSGRATWCVGWKNRSGASRMAITSNACAKSEIRIASRPEIALVTVGVSG